MPGSPWREFRVAPARARVRAGRAARGRAPLRQARTADKAWLRSVFLLAAACTATALAQEDAPLPPRILDDPPGRASLAELPNDRVEVLEEIVVVARDEWRLPDLGANWRARFEQPVESRVAMRYLPLYDPEMADRWPDLFQLGKQEERTGYIELFRIRFGSEARQATVPTVLNPDP